MNTTAGGMARILLIADDPTLCQNYAGALHAAGYDVTLAESFVDVLGTAMPDPDAIVLCELAVFAYPGQMSLVIRASNRMAPDDLVAEVHRRLALRAASLTTVG